MICNLHRILVYNYLSMRSVSERVKKIKHMQKPLQDPTVIKSKREQMKNNKVILTLNKHDNLESNSAHN